MQLVEHLWSKKGRVLSLLIASAVLLFTLLGARDIWTQEHRWADIVSGMFYRHDFLHPYLGNQDYYDKPLLSYWLIAIFAKIWGGLTTFTLRLPSALAGLLAVWSIYQLGAQLKDRALGLLAGWLLLTTFYFIFWARTSSADMLNLAGSLFAIAWYFQKRAVATWRDYAVFFMIIALTALCKGLIGAIIPAIAVAIDLVLSQSLKKHLRFAVLPGLVIALFVYLLPFIASSYWNHSGYHENGLYLVYRENVLRYFHPFDHQGPIYTYLIYLPLYLLPWTIFFIPAVYWVMTQFKTLPSHSKWIACTCLALFIFFTLSGSRRSYYVLPLVPFSILLTADWILLKTQFFSNKTFWGIVIIFWAALLMMLDIGPAYYYTQYGAGQFATLLKQEATQTQPWQTWHIVMLDAESKLNFYLSLPPDVPHYGIKGSRRTEQDATRLLQAWPCLTHPQAHTIFVTRQQYVPALQQHLKGYRLVALPSSYLKPIGKPGDQPAAFISG